MIGFAARGCGFIYRRWEDVSGFVDWAGTTLSWRGV